MNDSCYDCRFREKCPECGYEGLNDTKKVGECGEWGEDDVIELGCKKCNCKWEIVQ